VWRVARVFAELVVLMDRPAGGLENVTVKAPCGRLAGLRRGDVFAFKGIPFATPPVGCLRWRMPEPLPPWSGVRDATHFSPICPQAPFFGDGPPHIVDCPNESRRLAWQNIPEGNLGP
jgi:para-nitrobenzyl esterase